MSILALISSMVDMDGLNYRRLWMDSQISHEMEIKAGQRSLPRRKTDWGRARFSGPNPGSRMEPVRPSPQAGGRRNLRIPRLSDELGDGFPGFLPGAAPLWPVLAFAPVGCACSSTWAIREAVDTPGNLGSGASMLSHAGPPQRSLHHYKRENSRSVTLPHKKTAARLSSIDLMLCAPL